MKQFMLAVTLAALTATASWGQQCATCGGSVSDVKTPSYDADGLTQPQVDYIRPRDTIKLGLRDRFSPSPFYSHSNVGLAATNIHNWNQQQANIHSWHGQYNYWKYQSPTALVVPPTASYMTSYAWGVGQVRSTPIHHQFGRRGGLLGGGGGGFLNTPRHPYSTDQLGVYPVRGAW